MPIVELTPHLFRFFPQLADQAIEVPAGSVAEVVRAVDALAPGFADYVLDDQGRLRRHVRLCIDDNLMLDREELSDRVAENSRVYIFQALSGG